MTDRVSRRRLLALLGAGLGPLAGCGYRPGGGDIRWTIQTGTGPYRPEFVLAAGETLFTVNRSRPAFDMESKSFGQAGRITAYDATTGTELWHESLYPLGQPAVHDDTLYVGHKGGDLLAVGTDGTERWRTQVGAFPRFIAATAHHVYTVTTAGVLYAFEIGDGTQMWQQSVDGGESYALTATSDDVFVISVTETSMTTVTAMTRDGTQRWSRERSGRRGHEAGRPIIDGKTVYISIDRGLSALAVDDGSERWSHRGGRSRGIPTVSNETVYYTGDNTLYAVRTRDGQEQWTFGSTYRYGVKSPPAVAGDTVYVGGLDGFSALAAADGTVHWQVRSDNVTDTLVVGQTAIAAMASGTVRGHWRESSTR